MFDPIGNALRATSSHTLWAVPIVFVAGICSSVGPCIAPRFIAAAALAAGKHGRGSAIAVASLVCGLVAAYACFGAVTSLVGRAVQYSSAIYALLAAVLACAGVSALWRGSSAPCSHSERHTYHSGIGGAFLLGASFAFVVSPCCTPLVVGILAYTSQSGDALYGSALLAIFAFGHTLPLLGVGGGARRLAVLFSNGNVTSAVSTAAAALMLALSAYYAVLA